MENSQIFTRRMLWSLRYWSWMDDHSVLKYLVASCVLAALALGAYLLTSAFLAPWWAIGAGAAVLVPGMIAIVVSEADFLAYGRIIGEMWRAGGLQRVWVVVAVGFAPLFGFISGTAHMLKAYKGLP